jgi:uncharacterized protein YecT (DUF1311 family)
MLLAFLLLTAQDRPIDCDKDQTQLAMNICADRDFQAADAKLNKQWKIALARMKDLDVSYDRDRREGDTSAGYAPTLLESQRAWLKYREAQCAVEGQYMRGGSGEPMMYSTCMASLTRNRTAFLATLLEDH